MEAGWVPDDVKSAQGAQSRHKTKDKHASSAKIKHHVPERETKGTGEMETPCGASIPAIPAPSAA